MIVEATYDIIIIGAGISGLTAANLLAQHNGVTFKVLEASPRIGGRIRSSEGFSDFPVELGAEEVHGERTAWYELLKSRKVSFVEEQEEDYFWWRYQFLHQEAFNKLDDACRIRDLEEVIPSYAGEEKSVRDFIIWYGIPYRVHHIINAYYGAEYGTSMNRVSMISLRKNWHKWNAGEENYRLRGTSHQSVLDQHFATVLKHVQTDTAIESVDTRGNYIRLMDARATPYKCQSVIVTVPLPILQKKMLNFVPQLPENYRMAIDGLEMGKGLKAVLKFKHRFWPDKMGSVYGSGLVAEFWATGLGRSKKNNLLTAYCMGDAAERLGAMDEKSRIEKILIELDLIFGEAVASKEYEEALWVDWTKEPYILGSYTYPSKNDNQYRRILSRPLNDRIFFAGEATNTKGHYGSVHGAVESAIRAVQDWEEAHLLGKGKSDM